MTKTHEWGGQTTTIWNEGVCVAPMTTTATTYKKEVYDYLAYLKGKGRSERTVNNYDRCLNTLFNTMGKMGLNNSAHTVTEADVIHYKEHCGLKESTIRMYFTVLDSFLEYHTGSALTKGMDILWNRRTFSRTFITKEDLHNVLTYAEPRARICLFLGAYMGLRTIEMERMRLEDIHQDYITVYGKGHGAGLREDQPMPPKVREELDAYLLWRRSLGLEDRTEGHLLFKYEGNTMIPVVPGNNLIWRIIKDAGKKAGVEITTHSLRRLYATTLYYDLNVDTMTLKTLMRHSDVSTTFSHYINPYGVKRNEAVSRLNDYL